MSCRAFPAIAADKRIHANPVERMLVRHQAICAETAVQPVEQMGIGNE